MAAFGNGDAAHGGSGSDFINASVGTGQLIDCGSAFDYHTTDGTDTIRRCEGLGDPNS